MMKREVKEAGDECILDQNELEQSDFKYEAELQKLLERTRNEIASQRVEDGQHGEEK